MYVEAGRSRTCDYPQFNRRQTETRHRHWQRPDRQASRSAPLSQSQLSRRRGMEESTSSSGLTLMIHSGDRQGISVAEGGISSTFGATVVARASRLSSSKQKSFVGAQEIGQRRWRWGTTAGAAGRHRVRCLVVLGLLGQPCLRARWPPRGAPRRCHEMPRDANILGRLGMDCLNGAASALEDDKNHKDLIHDGVRGYMSAC